MRKTLLVSAAVLAFAAIGSSFAATDITAPTGPGSVGTATGQGNTLHVSHHAIVNIPSVVLLKVVGTAGNASVVFNTTASDMLAAANSGGTGILVTPDTSASGFQAVKAFSNVGNTYAVNASISADSTANSSQDPTTASALLSQIELATGSSAYTAINGNSVSKSVALSPSAGWTPVWQLGDFRLLLNGTEAPGTYSYTVEYSVTVP